MSPPSAGERHDYKRPPRIDPFVVAAVVLIVLWLIFVQPQLL